MDQNRPTDDLLRDVADGDAAAFAVVYRRHIDDVMTYAVNRCRDPHEVAELCAATFVAVWEGAAGFDPARGTAAAWIIGIAGRRLADLRRSDARRLRLAQRLQATSLLTGDDIDRIAERIDAARLAPAARRAVDALPGPQRDVLRHVGAGRSPDEAAAALGISPSAARMRLMRARRAVRVELAEESP